MCCHDHRAVGGRAAGAPLGSSFPVRCLLGLIAACLVLPLNRTLRSIVPKTPICENGAAGEAGELVTGSHSPTLDAAQLGKREFLGASLKRFILRVA
jgi:hypothetical protein